MRKGHYVARRTRYTVCGANEDLQRAFTLLENATKSGQIVMSQAMELTRVHASLFKPITEKLQVTG
jgi:hypothetical protein